MRKQKISRNIFICLVIIFTVFLSFSMLGTAAQAAGLIDNTINLTNEYSKFSLENYQLDFYVDTSWDWLPWNWSDGIGKSVQYALYAITNFIWTLSTYISGATGYVIQQAYKLDFIADTSEFIGKNMQTLAGVNENGFSGQGFYTGFLLLFILIIGIYVTYTGLLKREATKAVRSVINFVLVFILSASFIAYAPEYIQKINSFSADVSNASLSIGTKIVLPDSDSQGRDSVDLIRDSLFSIQVQKPWLLLQYGKTNVDKERYQNLLCETPDSKDRMEIVIEEIEDNNNSYMSVGKTINRLGTVVFLFIFNIGISIFVFLLCGMMIFSQVLFIAFAMFLPVSFLISMLPSHENASKKALVKLFNTIMLRAGLTLVITVAFSISTMFYNISSEYPFFMIAFLQIVTFAGIYFKLGDIMSMFSLQATDSQQMGRRIFHKPYMYMNRRAKHIERRLNKIFRNKAKDKSYNKDNYNWTGTTNPTYDRQNVPVKMLECKPDKKSDGKGGSKQTKANSTHSNSSENTKKDSVCKREIIKEVQNTKDRKTNHKNISKREKTDKKKTNESKYKRPVVKMPDTVKKRPLIADTTSKQDKKKGDCKSTEQKGQKK